MWIAKPLAALRPEEREAWVLVQSAWLAAGRDVPLSQTLTWGNAMSAQGVRAYLVFDPVESVGGLVFALASHQGGVEFECVNGPLLDWDRPEAVARQFATFAMAASKLDRGFSSLRVAPRWERGEGLGMEERLGLLPLEMTSLAEAATLQIAVEDSGERLKASLSPRLRRTLRFAEKSSLRTESWGPDHERLSLFASEMAEFGSRKGFAVPNEAWFRALTAVTEDSLREGISFRLRTAECEVGETRSEILVCRHRANAHYLFGYERRAPGARAALSPAAWNHWSVIRDARSEGLRVYDLNGYVEDLDGGNSYAGVCRFKAQFGGAVVNYDVPEFVIST